MRRGGREAFGVRPACRRFPWSSGNRERQQAARTPDASRGLEPGGGSGRGRRARRAGGAGLCLVVYLGSGARRAWRRTLRHKMRRMKIMHAIAMLGLLVVMPSAPLGRAATVYDNGISSVNNGRVNDMNYPVFDMHADNFSLAVGATVNQVSWLGGYKNGNLLPDADDSFTISFFAFGGGTPATTAFATFVVGAVPRQLTSQTLSSGSPIFSYSAQFPDTQLSAGTYLLSIMNQHAGTKQWFWADLDSPAGDSFGMVNQGTPWHEFSGGGVAEFAFTLVEIPEPSAAGLIWLGILISGVLHARLRLSLKRTRCSEPGDDDPIDNRGSVARDR
jgi:hypothetical protein